MDNYSKRMFWVGSGVSIALRKRRRGGGGGGHFRVKANVGRGMQTKIMCKEQFINFIKPK